MESDRLVFKGAKEICGAVGVNWKDIGYYVNRKGLPAFKIDGRGAWIAIPVDLALWVEKQRDENLGKDEAERD